jgi:hypothetical protein
MSNIISFPAREGPRLPARRRSESAEILFFLGVRYERAATAPIDETRPRHSGPNARKSSTTPRRRAKRSA